MVQDVLTVPAQNEQIAPLACPFDASRLELTVDREPSPEELALCEDWQHAVDRWHAAVAAQALGQRVSKLGLGLLSGLTGALLAQRLMMPGLEVVGLTLSLIAVRHLLALVQARRIASMATEIEAIAQAADALAA